MTASTFISPSVAADIDRAEGRLCAGFARQVGGHLFPGAAVIEVGGGVAVFAGPGAPANKMVGVGFGRVPPDAELDAVEALFTERGAPLQAEISTLADPEMHATLARRGYQLRGFENVLGYGLARAVPITTGRAVEISVLEDRDRGRLVDLLVEAWRWPDVGGIGGDTIPPSEELRRWLSRSLELPGYLCIAARIDGVLVGGAAMLTDGAIAQFCGAATLPHFRRRGVQTALLRWRLAHAQMLGCALAVVTTQPASKSQENVQREGFQLLYARQLLVKETSASPRP